MAAPTESAPAPAPEPISAPETTSAAPAGAAPAGDSPSPIQGVLQAHSDIVSWINQSHGALFDNGMSVLFDNNGVRREHVLYAVCGFLALGLCVFSSAPLLCAFITVPYPVFSSASALKDINQSPRWMVYWTIFSLFAIVDYFLSEVPLYFLLKTLVLVFLYLPQTQGAVIFHTRIIEPAYNFVDANVLKKFQ